MSKEKTQAEEQESEERRKIQGKIDYLQRQIDDINSRHRGVEAELSAIRYELKQKVPIPQEDLKRINKRIEWLEAQTKLYVDIIKEFLIEPEPAQFARVASEVTEYQQRLAEMQQRYTDMRSAFGLPPESLPRDLKKNVPKPSEFKSLPPAKKPAPPPSLPPKPAKPAEPIDPMVKNLMDAFDDAAGESGLEEEEQKKEKEET